MSLKEFSEQSGKSWKEINSAKDRTKNNKKIIADAILNDNVKPFDNDIDFVVFGSIARDESTEQSDVDWTLLLDGQSDPNDYETGRYIRNKLIERKLIEPSPSGLFGQITFSHDLIHYIGGEEDSN